MSVSDLYPASPSDAPANLTLATPSYKRQAWLALLGLTAFMLIYVLLMLGFGLIAYRNLIAVLSNDSAFGNWLVLFCASILFVFMAKSLFSMRKMGNPNGIEVTAAEQPKLFEFLHRLADEIQAPRPHRVFITPEVNAAVFYDLSLMNLIVPSKKNLIVGLGLVNVLNLAELKAVLAHEFGHFSQNSMVVGRWVYVAQQIIAHMVSVRDWLDKLVRLISRIDIRIAWIGWILQLIIWSLRSLMDTLFRIVIIAERALSREMEFNADLVAVSVTGSDALINALYKLQAADQAWQTAMNVARSATGRKEILDDLFMAQSEALKEMRRILDDQEYGLPPQPDGDAEQHRVFEEAAARPPQMWSTHPANSDREANAKSTYVAAASDDRSAWLLFENVDQLRQDISLGFYNKEAVKGFDVASPAEAVGKQFKSTSYSPEYRGAYLGRSPVRDFDSVSRIFEMTNVPAGTVELDTLYPEKIGDDLKAIRNLELERSTLEALASGELKPSGGVIRHRGEDINKDDIPAAVEEIIEEKKIALDKLMQHEADCRQTYLNIAEQQGQGWPEHLKSTLEFLHCSDHLLATVSNERALLVNTWHVITADGKVGYFEKKRILRVAEDVHRVMSNVSEKLNALVLPDHIMKQHNISDWAEVCPKFELPSVDKKNWAQWCQAAIQIMAHFEQNIGLLYSIFLEELLASEATLKRHYLDKTNAGSAPAAGTCVSEYPTLLSGDEHALQTKLDLWNRFQLAHGVFPTLMRALVALTIVGGTIFIGLTGT